MMARVPLNNADFEHNTDTIPPSGKQRMSEAVLFAPCGSTLFTAPMSSQERNHMFDFLRKASENIEGLAEGENGTIV